MSSFKNFIAQIAGGDNIGAKSSFEEIISAKTSLSLESRKQEIASTLFQDESIIDIGEELKGNQHKLDKNKNGKVDADDFKKLRKEEKTPIKTSKVGAGRSVTLFKHPKGEHSIERNDGKVLHYGTEASAKKLWGELYEEISMDEDVDQIDELSKGTLGSYVNKAAHSAAFNAAVLGAHAGLGAKGTSNADREHDIVKKRLKGIGAASKKLSNPSRPANRHVLAHLATLEGYEPEGNQIDEISKRLKADYIKAASHDIATKGAMTRHYGELSQRQAAASRAATAHLTPDGSGYAGGGPRAGAGDSRDNNKMADKIFAKSWKRRQFMAKAADQLASESVELEPGQGSHLNIGGARVKNDRESVLAHVRKTFPNAKDIEKKERHGWGPK